MADSYIFMIDDPVWFEHSNSEILSSEEKFPWDKKIEKANFRGAPSSLHREYFKSLGFSTSSKIDVKTLEYVK